MDHRRADPEELLERVRAEEERRGKGKLKIFFGAAPGVGKTYAMLEAAHREKAAGVDVVVGFLETHGRAGTEALISGLEVVPRRSRTYRGIVLTEFDLDAALKRRPVLILLDELAHTNAPGSRHLKRWQDAVELLDQGVDVWTTLNVQHVESLNDVVAQITSVTVRETLPDALLARADEIELVDVSPEELVERLEQGKIYPREPAQRAQQGFFKRGNLLALRELALRRTAERVDVDVQAHRRQLGIDATWAVAEHILVCITGEARASALVRAGHRLASSLRAPLTVLHVSIPGREPDSKSHERLVAAQRLAEELAAEVVTRSGSRVGDEILAFAQSRNTTRILLGKPRHSRFRDLFSGALLNHLVREGGGIDVLVIAAEPGDEPKVARRRARSASLSAYARSLAIVGLATLASAWLFRFLGIANIVMLYLAGIVLVAIRFGRGPSIFASVLSVAAFDFFFIAPHLTFAVADVRDLFTFGVMLGVGLVISGLTERLRQHAEFSRLREERTAALYWLTRKLSQCQGVAELAAAAIQSIGKVFEGKSSILLPDAGGRLAPVLAKSDSSTYSLDEHERAVACWVFDHKEPAGLGTATLSGARALYLPLSAHAEVVGVLGLLPADPARIEEPDQRQLLATFCKQTAMALERAALAEEAHGAEIRAETEALRNSLLSSFSHDLRTPLAAITGAASSLRATDHPPGVRRELVETIYEEADRLNRLVGNLLDMTRLESRSLAARKEWTPLDEVVGSALSRLEAKLHGRAVAVTIPRDLPLVPLDGVLMEEVLFNLVENAIKYTPQDAPIEIDAFVQSSSVVLNVSDRGTGLPEGLEERIFEKFFRAPGTASAGGTGLGLAICRAVVVAHGGTITARNREGGGATFRIVLPLDGGAPAVPQEEPIARERGA